MWLILGTSPQLPEGEVLFGKYTAQDAKIVGQDGSELHLERGIETLATAAALVCAHLGKDAPLMLCGGDKGKGHGSRAVYAYAVEHLPQWTGLTGLTFHYLFPDVDWHNRVLMAVQDFAEKQVEQGGSAPLLVADAGFMYVAKMSGYADAYDLFTPDAGEMAFLADELAPHPFYTRGFLQELPESIDLLLARAHEHGNVAKNLIIKGSTDAVVQGKRILHKVSMPSVPSMEAIGGTGDLVSGMCTGLLACGFSMEKACLVAVKTNRVLAALAKPTPATQVHELTPYLCEALAQVLAKENAITPVSP